MQPPTFSDILAARRVLSRYLPRTPLYRYPLLDAEVGCEVHVKHENHQPIGAFKVRGGLFLMSRLSPEERSAGVITASTGNHGQSIAYAARTFGVRAIVAVPEEANPAKIASMRALGAEIVFHGRDFDDAREYAEERSRREGLRYIHSANEPDLVAGVATYALEMLEDEPELDSIFVPVGGGSGASGCSIVASSLRPELRVIAAQSEAAPAAWRSWKEGHLVEAPTATFAEGVATRTAFDLPQKILRERLSDFILVAEDAIRDSMLLYLRTTRNIAEGAGAIALAAARQYPSEKRGRKTGVVLSGCNVSPESLRELLTSSHFCR